MSFLRRLFDGRYRKAKKAEGAGLFREAAELYVELGEKELAFEALAHLGERADTLEARLVAWRDALHLLDASEKRDALETKLGLAILTDAELRGARSAEEKRRLAEAAERLEKLDACAEAARAYALLGRKEDQARCLELAGEIEALETLLDAQTEADAKTEALRKHLADYEAAMAYGARGEAKKALTEAVLVAPEDNAIADLLRRLEKRIPRGRRVRLLIDGAPVTFVGKLPVILGRGDADAPFRGSSVSRRHAEIDRKGEALVVRDLDSRNGTLVRGMPIERELRLSGETELGLGDDVTLRVRPMKGCVRIDVVRGMDRGERYVIGDLDLRLAELAATVRFLEGEPVLEADSDVELSLDGKLCALPIGLLHGDRIKVGEVEVEVLP